MKKVKQFALDAFMFTALLAIHAVIGLVHILTPEEPKKL